MADLYDVNALLALFDEEHRRHNSVFSQFSGNSGEGWASCPFTQNGYLRIRSQPNYPHRLSISEACGQLLDATSTSYHQFLRDDISILDDMLVEAQRLSGHSQITDVYLLALAVAHDARLVTLDRRIPLTTVRGATEEHLVVL